MSAMPQPAQQVLNEYTALVHTALPGLLEGIYVHGSVALHAYTPGLSDIDFISITSRRRTDTDIDSLRALHHTLTQRYPDVQLEGGYLLTQDIGRFEESMPPHPHVHAGIVHASGYHDINAVTWWILKHRGIAIYGPPPDQLAIQIDWQRLLADMHHNLNSYWAGFISNPRRIAWLLNDYGIQWAVLGVLRQFYTFRERAITSNTGCERWQPQDESCGWYTKPAEAGCSINEPASAGLA